MAQYQSKVENVFGISGATWEGSVSAEFGVHNSGVALSINNVSIAEFFSLDDLNKAISEITGHNSVSNLYNASHLGLFAGTDFLTVSPSTSVTRIPDVISFTDDTTYAIKIPYSHSINGVSVRSALNLTSTSPVATVQDIKDLFTNAGYTGSFHSDVDTPTNGWATPKITVVDVTGQLTKTVNFVNTSPTTVTKTVINGPDISADQLASAIKRVPSHKRKTNYAVGDLVRFNASIWECKLAHRADSARSPVPQSKYWDLLLGQNTQGVNFYHGFSKYNYFNEGDLVLNAGEIWMCIKGHGGKTVTFKDPSYWTKLN